MNGFVHLSRLRARNRLIERRIRKIANGAAPTPDAPAAAVQHQPEIQLSRHADSDPMRPVQSLLRRTGLWHKSTDFQGAPARLETQHVVLPSLPWAMGALAPVISSRTLQYHYSHHHVADIDATNRLLRGRAELAGKKLRDIVLWAARHEPQSALFQRASQAWNHSFFWSSLCPSKSRPTGVLRQAIERDFGDYEKFAQEFAAAGAQHFGSGWLWLSVDADDVLRIRACSDANTPLTHGERCLLTVDLWEHAYYLDHQDRRCEYLQAVIDRRLNWTFAQANLTARPAAHRVVSSARPAGDPQ